MHYTIKDSESNRDCIATYAIPATLVAGGIELEFTAHHQEEDVDGSMEDVYVIEVGIAYLNYYAKHKNLVPFLRESNGIREHSLCLAPTPDQRHPWMVDIVRTISPEHYCSVVFSGVGYFTRDLRPCPPDLAKKYKGQLNAYLKRMRQQGCPC